MSVERPDAAFRRVYPLWVEMGAVTLVLAVWQLLRIPFAGSVPEALRHAHSWLSAERAIGLDFEPALIRAAHEHGHLLWRLVSLGYSNLHLIAIFAFLATARLLAPLRYPKVRTAFALAHAPALAVLAAYPLAPPHWVVGLPFASGPPEHTSALRNETAAAVSLHFGYPILIAGASLWLRPRSPLAWLTLLYPPLVFFVIVGSGNHYVLDTLVGTACIAFGVAGAHVLHGPAPENGVPAPGRRILVAAAVFGLAGFLVNGLLTGELR